MKYAIVTGGARGLGLGIVNALFEEKVVEKIAVIDRELAPPPAAIAANVSGFVADVTDEGQVRRAGEEIVGRFGGGPGVLGNNAGGGARAGAAGQPRARDWVGGAGSGPARDGNRRPPISGARWHGSVRIRRST